MQPPLRSNSDYILRSKHEQSVRLNAFKLKIKRYIRKMFTIRLGNQLLRDVRKNMFSEYFRVKLMKSWVTECATYWNQKKILHIVHAAPPNLDHHGSKLVG